MAIILGALLPIGSSIHSDLTESQFQAEMGLGWILEDGRSVVGSRYHSITGKTSVNDARDVFLRGKGNGRGLNPDGDLSLGTYTADKIKQGASDFAISVGRQNAIAFDSMGSMVTGGFNPAETAPKSIIKNIFIRIN